MGSVEIMLNGHMFADFPTLPPVHAESLWDLLNSLNAHMLTDFPALPSVHAESLWDL